MEMPTSDTDGPHTSDQLDELARRAATGDQAALIDLLSQVESLVKRWARRLLPNVLDAEEACQDTLLAVSRRIGTFDGRARFTTWLYQVTTNASIDTYRRLKRQVLTTDLDQLPLEAPERTSVIAGNRVDLMEALERIDERIAAPLVMRDVYGLPYSEIAELLDIPSGTVKSRIHDARRTLEYHLTRG
jgi:RNA polymerase sigma-70 factor (ECF subfamily)